MENKPVFNPPTASAVLGMNHLCGCVSIKKGAKMHTKLCAKHLKEVEEAANNGHIESSNKP